MIFGLVKEWWMGKAMGTALQSKNGGFEASKLVK